MSEAYIVVYRQHFEFDHIGVYTDEEDARERLKEEVEKFSNVEVLEVEEDYYATANKKHEWFLTTAPLYPSEEDPRKEVKY